MSKKIHALLEFNVSSYYNDDVARHIDLQSKSEEYDCVTFGVETNAGKVIKVYVQSDQADDFEKKLADSLLEKNADLEDIFNELNRDFNIVDIVWPNEKTNDNHDKTLQDLLNDKDDISGTESLNPNVKYESKLSSFLTKKYMIEAIADEISTDNKPEEQVKIQKNNNDNNDIKLSGLGSSIYFVLLEIGLPEKIITDNKTEFSNIISKYTANLFYDYSDRLAALRFFKENTTRLKKNINESIEDSEESEITFNGQLSHYFNDKRQQQIYNLINYLGITDDLIMKHGNAELFIQSVIDKGNFYKRNTRFYAYFLELYRTLFN